MSRQSSDSIVSHSSIALLQERFRQLQRVKEMRKEREFMRLIPESPRVNPTKDTDPSRLFSHSELILPPRPSLYGSPPIQPNLQNKHTDLQVTETPILANLWSTDGLMHRTKNFNDSDVDTSLHL